MSSPSYISQDPDLLTIMNWISNFDRRNLPRAFLIWWAVTKCTVECSINNLRTLWVFENLWIKLSHRLVNITCFLRFNLISEQKSRDATQVWLDFLKSIHRLVYRYLLKSQMGFTFWLIWIEVTQELCQRYANVIPTTTHFLLIFLEFLFTSPLKPIRRN